MERAHRQVTHAMGATGLPRHAPRERASRVPAREAGFSLVSVIVALAVLSLTAGAAAPLALRSLRGNRTAEAVARLEATLCAMLGDPARGTPGYLGDMGALPDTGIAQLVLPGAEPPAVASAVDGIVSGYAGPYTRAPLVDPAQPGLGARDPWGSTIVYVPGTAQLRSLGPDRAAGTADDIVLPSLPARTTGIVTVIASGLPRDGGPAVPLRSDEAIVAISYTRASDHTRASSAAVHTGDEHAGVWISAGALHLGAHGVTVTGLDATSTGGRSYTGASAHDIAVIDGAATAVYVALREAP
jgi:type II secretory pathway pseudopilin PulG